MCLNHEIPRLTNLQILHFEKIRKYLLRCLLSRNMNLGLGLSFCGAGILEIDMFLSILIISGKVKSIYFV